MYKEIWFRGLSKDDKELLKKQLSNSLIADRLREIITEWERGLVVTKGDYDLPSWAYRQAHQNGMSEILDKLKSILTPDQKGK